ncbi:MAG TPA: YfcE family phosphodiesterase [bacterium]
MKIAILSDIHDHLENLRSALRLAQESEVLICCGDLCSPFIIDELAKGFPNREIHIVFGNNDADLFRITTRAAAYPHLKLHGEFVELSLGGKKIAVNHFDNIGHALARCDSYDVVCFGHNHQFEITAVGHTLIVNPGEVMGELMGAATFVIYDSDQHEAKRVDI